MSDVDAERTREIELERWFIDLCQGARLRPSRDEDRTVHVVGRRGDIYAQGLGRLAFCLKEQTAQMKNAIKRKYVPSLFTEVLQECDEEAVFVFAPDRLAEAARVARCRFRRVLSAEQLADLASRGAGTRFPSNS